MRGPISPQKNNAGTSMDLMGELGNLGCPGLAGIAVGISEMVLWPAFFAASTLSVVNDTSLSALHAREYRNLQMYINRPLL